jgi:hypothetical protein
MLWDMQLHRKDCSMHDSVGTAIATPLDEMDTEPFPEMDAIRLLAPSTS